MNQEDNTLQSQIIQITPDFYVDKSSQLGRGDFGIVYKGFHLSTNRIIAVKFISKKMLAKCSGYEREIMVMHDLAKIKHPNIMEYYGYESNQEGLYYFIEFCNGGTLKNFIKKKISELKILSLLHQIIEGMTYMNSQNKIHRDLKSENILLDQNGDLKIADFGLARDIQEIMTKGVCTPIYAAPQVMNGKQYDSKCDVWSTGLILYEMLTNKQMFDGIKTKNELFKQVSKFQNLSHRIQIQKQLHYLWNQILDKMLTYKVSQRPTFKELEQYFKTIEPKMKNDLIQKYGEEKSGVEAYEVSLRLTKSVSPYHQNSIISPLADIHQKLNQQKSFNNLNNLRKWLNFSRQKSEIMLKLIKQFSNSSYDCIRNVNKYVLMFLSISCYISRMINYSNEVSKKKVLTPDNSISQKDIANIHIKQYKQMLKQTLQKQQASITKYKNILQKQIIIKLMDTYFKKPQQQKIMISYENLVTLIKQAKQGRFYKQQIYSAMLKKVANSFGIRFPDKLIKQLKYEDIKVYAYIRVIACLDQVFLNNNFKNDDYLRSKKQQMQNATKQELSQISLQYNYIAQ